ncbi:hypothetical protein [Methylobacterium indicum]|nr:hypothetical protein [Methylobacterium indicum]
MAAKLRDEAVSRVPTAPHLGKKLILHSLAVIAGDHQALERIILL